MSSDDGEFAVAAGKTDVLEPDVVGANVCDRRTVTREGVPVDEAPEAAAKEDKLESGTPEGPEAGCPVTEIAGDMVAVGRYNIGEFVIDIPSADAAERSGEPDVGVKATTYENVGCCNVWISKNEISLPSNDLERSPGVHAQLSLDWQVYDL